MEDIIPQIPAWILIAFGVVLMAFEMITTVFILIFFGIAFSAVGVASFFIEMAGEVQILVAMVVGGLLTFVLREYFLKTILAKNLELETLNIGEVGVLSEYNGELRVSYKGTSWAIQTDSGSFKDGESVIVKDFTNNIATVEKR